MSNSDDSQFANDIPEDGEKKNNKKSKLIKSVESLKVIPSEEELTYRKTLENIDILTEFPNKVKCTKCKLNFKLSILEGKNIYSHPLLDVLMCKSCCTFYGNGDFSLDEDKEDKYCRWCGEGGQLFLCAKCICGFCPSCIKRHFGNDKVKEIREDDDWICYFCNPKPLWELRAICDLAKKHSEKNKKNKVNEDNEQSIINSVKRNPKRKSRRGVQSLKESVFKDDSNSMISCSDSSLSNDTRTFKKRRTTRPTAWGKSSVRGRKKAQYKSKSGLSRMYSNESSISSDDSSEDEVIQNSKFNRSKEEIHVLKSKERNLEKLKQILKVAETTSELCLVMCQKKIKKLGRKDYMLSDEKLMTECERLKSMIILMSSSLSTVHNLIISLQQKCGNKETTANIFGGSDDTTLLTAMNQILREKQVKTRYLVQVVNDILNRYPYIAVASKCYNDVLAEKMDAITGSEDLTKEESALLSEEKTKFADSDSDETQIFCFNSESGHNAEGESLGRNISRDNSSASDTELDKMYADSQKLKAELLMSSDCETQSNSTLVSNTDVDNERKKCRKGLKSSHNQGYRKISREDKILRELMNLSSIERKWKRTESLEESNTLPKTIDQESQLQPEETKDGRESDSASCHSDSDTVSAGSRMIKNHNNRIEYIQENALMLKRFILDSTSSSDINEDESDRNEEKVKDDFSAEATARKKNIGSRKIDQLSIDLSGDSSTSSDALTPLKKREKIKKSSDSLDSISDSEDCIKLTRRKRNNRSLISTSDEDSDSVLETGRIIKSISESPAKGRKNIKKIIKKENLKLETRQAIKMENERKKRIAEREELYKKFFPKTMDSERLVLDFNKTTGEATLEVPKELARVLKPHQREGVKFMWDCCFESLENLEETTGTGCILSHCMGLGKTLQIITLVYTVMKNDIGVNTVLVTCPLNVVNNWIYEFEFWLKKCEYDIEVYSIHNCKKSMKYYQIKQWYEGGGVLVLSYDMMRNFTTSNRRVNSYRLYPKNLSEFLVDPGPDLVVCDEGHLLKNEDTALSRCMAKIRTSRRIILTGTPLQNNLLEYHSMIQFIKPNILGTRKEFMNRFSNPIMNGQFEDSTAADVKLMRARSHVLHKLLDGCIQRFNYSVLKPFLPEKHEYVISIRLTETQAKLYRHYAEKCRNDGIGSSKGTKLFSDFSLLQKIWTHPRTLSSYMKKQSEKKVEYDDEAANRLDDSVLCVESGRHISTEDTFWKEAIKPEEYGDISSSGKLVILFEILKNCHATGEKLLVFSHSLYNLDLIEYFLKKMHRKRGSSAMLEQTWEEGIDYFRLEGSTNSEVRSKWCKCFNNKNNKRSRLFLISTKAGGLGINLVAANRVVLFDVSWNPSHDVQSIFRVYRFGQTKNCYIYRLVAEGTMEEKIYKRQVTKVSLEKRVLDEHQIERHYTMGNLQELYMYNPLAKEKWSVPKLPKDIILADILNNHKDIIVAYHEHDSLLENKEEDEMTEEERRAAWDDFEKERFMFENELQKRRLLISAFDNQGVDLDIVTREALAITRLNRSSLSETWSKFLQRKSEEPVFKITDVRSLGEPSPAASDSQAKRIGLHEINADNIRHDNIMGYLNIMRRQIEQHCTEGQVLKESLAALRDCFEGGGSSATLQKPEGSVRQSPGKEDSEKHKNNHYGVENGQPQDAASTKTSKESTNIQAESTEGKYSEGLELGVCAEGAEKREDIEPLVEESSQTERTVKSNGRAPKMLEVE